MAEPAVPASPPHSLLPQLTWWQALLLYPALGSAVLAAIPTVWHEVKAWRLGVASSRVQLVEEQQRLWENNLDCLTQQGVWEVDGPDGLVVRASLCRTGDVLLRYYQNDWVPQMQWIAKPAKKGPSHAEMDTPAAAPARRLRGSP